MPSPCLQSRLEQAQAVKCLIFRRCPLEHSLDSATNKDAVSNQINIASTLRHPLTELKVIQFKIFPQQENDVLSSRSPDPRNTK
jgi:hypothetical protein